MNFDANNPVLDKKWDVGDIGVMLSNRASNGLAMINRCDPYIMIYDKDGEGELYLPDSEHCINLAQVLVSAASELQKMETPPIYLLYRANTDNRSGEDFVHAFVGVPSKEAIEKHTGAMTEQQYQTMLICDKEIRQGDSVFDDVYWLTKQ